LEGRFTVSVVIVIFISPLVRSEIATITVSHNQATIANVIFKEITKHD